MKELKAFNCYLNSIIKEDSNWKNIYAANKNTIADPNKIYPGQTLQMPGGGTYTVKKGDTLSKIAAVTGQGAMRTTPKAEPTPTTSVSPTQLPKTQQAAQSQFQTADDFVRAMANAATFGYADKAAAWLSSKTGGKDYGTELKKEYGKSAEAGKRSPTASTAGEIAGTVASPAFAGGAALGTKALARVAPQAGKLAQFGAGAAGGFAADTAAEKAAKAIDPTNPWIDESNKTMKIKEFTDKDLSEAPIKAVSSALRANRGRSLSGALGGAGSRAERLAAQSAELSPADKLNKEVGAKVWRSGEPTSTVDRLNKAAGAKVWRQGEPAAAAVTGGEKIAAGVAKGGKPLGRGTTAALSALGGGLIGYGLGSGEKGEAPMPTADAVTSTTPSAKPRTRVRPSADIAKPTPGEGPQAMAPTISDRAEKGDDPHLLGTGKTDELGDIIQQKQDEKPIDWKSANPQIPGVIAEDDLNMILKLAGRK